MGYGTGHLCLFLRSLPAEVDLLRAGKELSLCQKGILLDWTEESLFEGNSWRAALALIFALLFALLCR
jgi:hypothetical protein